MGSQRPPCPHCGGFLVRDFDILKNGDTVAVVRCVNCGWRLTPPPLVTKPSIDITLYRRPMRIVDRRHKADPTYAATTNLGICRNCGRHMTLVTGHMCRFCADSEDRELSRIQVQAWLDAGSPIPLGSWIKWRWKPVEEIGLAVRASRTDSVHA